MDRDRESGRKPSRAMTTHCQDVAGRAGSKLKTMLRICYRSPAMVTNTQSGRSAHRPCGRRPCRRAGHRLLRQPLQNAWIAVGPWQWGLELLEAKNHLPQSVHWPPRSVLCPQGRIKPGVLTRETEASKTRGRGKKSDAAACHQGVSQPRLRLRSGGSNPVREAQELLCSVIGLQPSKLGIGLVLA